MLVDENMQGFNRRLTINKATYQGWQMAQDRLNKMSWWDRLRGKKLADVVIEDINGQFDIFYNVK